nr:MAG TPA: Sporulation protein YhaL [Caudoviricetes sp.]
MLGRPLWVYLAYYLIFFLFYTLREGRGRVRVGSTTPLYPTIHSLI